MITPLERQRMKRSKGALGKSFTITIWCVAAHFSKRFVPSRQSIQSDISFCRGSHRRVTEQISSLASFIDDICSERVWNGCTSPSKRVHLCFNKMIDESAPQISPFQSPGCILPFPKWASAFASCSLKDYSSRSGTRFSAPFSRQL
jgi:hypothetical protein